MSNLEKWIKAILNEDADNLSIGSVRTLQMIKHEIERLQKDSLNLAVHESVANDVKAKCVAAFEYLKQPQSESEKQLLQEATQIIKDKDLEIEKIGNESMIFEMDLRNAKIEIERLKGLIPKQGEITDHVWQGQ